MKHKTVNLELTESNARYTLLALRELNERFFYANDLMKTTRAYEKIEKSSVKIFGDQIFVHNHDVL